MPKVETYGNDKVATRIANQPKFSTPKVRDNSAPITNGLNAFAQSVQKASNDLDDTRAEEALIQFERDKNDVFFNKDNGYFNSKGKDAYDDAEGVNKRLAELQKTYAKTLESEYAKQKFTSASDVHISRGLSSVSRHAATGLNDYENATIAARIENSIESAQQYYTDDSELLLQRTIGEDSVRTKGQKDGLTNDVIAENLQTYRSAFVKATIDAAATNDLARANELMGRMGDQLEGKDVTTVAKMLNKENDTAEVRAKTAEIMGDGSSNLASLSEKMDNLPDGTEREAKIKQEIIRNVKNEYTFNKRVHEDQVKEMYNEHGVGILKGDLKVGDIPIEDVDKLTSAQLSNLMKFERQLANGDAGVTDQAFMSEFRLKPKNEQAKTNPVDLYHKVYGKTDRKELDNIILKARKGEDAPEIRGPRSRSAEVTAALKQITGKKSSSRIDAEFSNAFHSLILDEVAAQTEATGKEVDAVQFTKIVHKMTRKFVEEGMIFDSDRDVEDVPPEHLQEIAAALRNRGLPVNGRSIAEMYLNAKKEGFFDE